MMILTRTATRSGRTRKRAFHFFTPGVVRCSQAAARQMRARGLTRPRIAAATAGGGDAAVYKQLQIND